MFAKAITIAATVLLGVSAIASAAQGGLRDLQTVVAMPRCAPHCDPKGTAYFGNFTLDDLPTLEDLNAIYDNFCNICGTFETIDDIFNSDFANFCSPICSIEIPDFSDGLQCFSELSTIQVEGQGVVSMKDLKVGDRVLTGNGVYEPVYAFGHKDPTATGTFLQLETSTTLEMTGGHLVFVSGKANPVRADSVKVGDFLQGEQGWVRSIKTVQREGLYAPLTPSGTVVVDGMLASSYISLQKSADEFIQMEGLNLPVSQQTFVHWMLSPYRMFCMGISSKLGNTYNEEGISQYVAYGVELERWAESQNILIQIVLLIAAFCVAGASMLVENTLGASSSPLVLIAGVGACAWMKKNNIAVRAKVKSV